LKPFLLHPNIFGVDIMKHFYRISFSILFQVLFISTDFLKCSWFPLSPLKFERERERERGGSTILKWILERQDGMVWIGLIWFRIGTSGGLL
jgi:hypothetical protein